MSSFKLQDFADACWSDILCLVQDAAVYIDHAAAECLHWYTGDKAYLTLKDAGASSVHDLAMYNFLTVKAKHSKKAVIISTSADPMFYQQTLKMIIEKNAFESCNIVCAAHYSILTYDTSALDENENSYQRIKNDVLDWMNSKNLLNEAQVEIMFRPIFTAAVNENIFLTPPFGSIMPPMDKKSMEEQELDVDFLVSSFHSLFTHFNLKEDIYSMGKCSEYITEKLENLPAAIDRRKRLVGQSGVSLILIDRTLDLCTATSNNSESVLGRILSTLPHLPHHYNDVAVNMSSLSPGGEEILPAMTVPGCLATKDMDILNLLISGKQRDVMLTMNNLLIDMLVKQSPKAKLATRISAHSLEKLLHKVRDGGDVESLIKSSKMLQQIVAVIQALKSEKTAQLELLISLEKLILQNLAVSRDSSSILAQLSNIVRTRNARGLDMDNLLALLIYISALAGKEIRFATQQVEQLKEAIAEAISEDINKCNDMSQDGSEMSVYFQTLFILGITDEDVAREVAEKMTQYITNVLFTIAQQRGSLQDYQSLMKKPSRQEMAQCVGILERLVTDLLDPSKPEIHDLQRKSSSYISAGFNLLLKGRTKTHPTDNSWIIIYIVGGITAEEAKFIQNIVDSKKSNCRITLAGSRFLNPLDIVEKILLPDQWMCQSETEGILSS